VFRKLSPVGLGTAHTQKSFLAALDEGGWLGTGALQRTTGVEGIMASEETLCVGFSCRAQGGTGGFVW